MSKYDDLFDETAPTESVFADKRALDPLAAPDEIGLYGALAPYATRHAPAKTKSAAVTSARNGTAVDRLRKSRIQKTSRFE